MRTFVVLTIVALFGAVACLSLKEPTSPLPVKVIHGKPPGTNCWLPPVLRKKMEEQKRMKELKEQEAKKVAETSGFNLSSFLPLNRWNLSRWNISKPTTKWNPAGFRFEETVPAPKPSFVQRIKNHVKKLWNMRPWKKATVKNTTEESSWNSAGFHIHHWNHTNKTNHTNHTWNSHGWRFEEETAPAQGFLHKIKHHAKKLWNMRPWKKAAKNTTEESSWNSAGVHFPQWNHTNKTNHTNHTWNSHGWRFEEETPVQKPSFVQRIKNHAKNLWAKRPWKKVAPAPAPEASSWNSAGVHFPQWNHTNKTNHTNHTWNNKGYRFEETAAPSFFDKAMNTVKGLWAKRPWKKAD